MTLRLNGSTSGYVEIDAPATAGSNTLVLPTGNGTNGQYLQTNGSGSLSWAGAGKILQVVNAIKTDTFSTSTGSFTDITGLSISITPSSASSKVFVIVSINPSGNANTSTMAFRVVRDTTPVFVGDAAGSRPRASFRSVVQTADYNHFQGGLTFHGLDSPASTSSLTYKLQMFPQGGQTGYVNRSPNDSDGSDSYHSRTASTITVMEVAA